MRDLSLRTNHVKKVSVRYDYSTCPTANEMVIRAMELGEEETAIKLIALGAWNDVRILAVAIENGLSNVVDAVLSKSGSATLMNKKCWAPTKSDGLFEGKELNDVNDELLMERVSCVALDVVPLVRACKSGFKSIIVLQGREP